MPVKAAPVQYVKICSLYGDGFYYIPGTDTCLKMGGYFRVQAEYNMGGGGVVVGDSAGGELSQGRFTRDLTNDINYRVRGAISWDVRQQTEYGTLRTYIRFGAENTTPDATGGGTTFNPFWDRAFIQFAGFTVGRSQSFFDLFTYGGAYSYHNVRVSGDTGASGQNLWAYTAQFGNGFSGTLSLEDPATRKGGTVDLATRGFSFDPGRRARQRQRVRDQQRRRQPSASGCLTSSPTCALIRPGASPASALLLHDASGAYYGANAATNVPPFGGVGNGHPADKYGWALAGGAKFNLAGGDMIGFNVCYAEGAPGFCTNNSCLHSSTTPAPAWAWAGSPTASSPPAPRSSSPRCGVLLPGTSTSGTRNGVPRCSAATSTSTTTAPPPTASCSTLRARWRPAASPAVGARLTRRSRYCRATAAAPTTSFWEAGTRTQWNPVPQLDIGLEVLYSQRNTAFKGAADRARQRLAARRSSPSTTRTSGPRCSAGSATSIHDRLSDPGKLASPRRPTAGGFASP